MNPGENQVVDRKKSQKSDFFLARFLAKESAIPRNLFCAAGAIVFLSARSFHCSLKCYAASRSLGVGAHCLIPATKGGRNAGIR